LSHNSNHHFWLQITSGDGPEECCRAVGKMFKEIIKEAETTALNAELLEALPSREKGNYHSVLLSINGRRTENFCRERQGSIQWICPSRYRPNHKRKNWFIGVEYFAPIEESSIDLSGITFQAIRASGPGGQHVNKASTAIRATHKASGLTARAGEERSQTMNKKLALARLEKMLMNQQQDKNVSAEKERWSTHKQLERGNPVRVYEGEKFKLKRNNT